MLLYLMPLMFGWFTLTVPAGLGLYWFTTSLVGIATSYLYYKPDNITLRWLVSLDALPPSAKARAFQESQKASEAPAKPAQLTTETPASDTADQRTPLNTGDDRPEDDANSPSAAARRRRRRRRRRGGSGRSPSERAD